MHMAEPEKNRDDIGGRPSEHHRNVIATMKEGVTMPEVVDIVRKVAPRAYPNYVNAFADGEASL